MQKSSTLRKTFNALKIKKIGQYIGSACSAGSAGVACSAGRSVYPLFWSFCSTVTADFGLSVWS